MKKQYSYKTILYYAVVIFAAIVAYQIFPPLTVNDRLSVAFSAERVADAINIISKKPHSIEHPKERKVVREYLYHRLVQMGASAQIFEYDSIKCKFGGYFDIANIYAEFPPAERTDTTRYVLLVAHYDSRYRQEVLENTVYSYGAADDGYGLGVILESVNVALKYREYWKQGIKVLFTDSEEHELDGMVNMAQHDSHILDNVNFVINVEARGVKGPALLFETAKGNEKVVELYKKAQNPYTYSLTTFIYSILPNNTDFTIVKESIPGMNFAVIDNLKYYHTDLDNYSNISLKSLQHYGLQIEPVLYEYLISSKYSKQESLRSENDSVFFTIPLLGLHIFSKTGYILFNIIGFLLFMLLLAYYVFLERIKFRDILKGVGYSAVFAFGALVVGEIIAFVAAYMNGEKFGLTSVKYVQYDYLITIISVLGLFLWTLIFFRLKEKNNIKFCYGFMLGTLLLIAVVSLVLLVFILENFYLFVPLFVVTVAMLLAILLRVKHFYVVSAFIVSVLGFSFLYCLITALTIGSLGIFLFITSLYISLLIAQYYCYKRKI